MDWSGRMRPWALAVLAGLAAFPAGAFGATHRGAASLRLGLAVDQALARHEGGNYVSSPLSLQEAFGMLSVGARGRTLGQLVSGLQLSPAGRPLLASMSSLQGQLSRGSAGGPVRLTVANAVWTQAGLPLRAAFTSALSRLSGAPPRAPDFRGDPAGAEQLINQWAATQTSGRITQVYAPGSLGPATRMVVTNAIDLDAQWLYPFDPRHSSPHDFHRLDGRVAQVPAMEADDVHLRYAKRGFLQAVELPYADHRLSMTLLVPDLGRFTHVARSLSAATVERLLARMRTSSVRLVMPKLSISAEPPLGEVLRSLGVRDAFDPARADFSGITPRRGLVLAGTRQVVSLTADELGTRAAAVTSGGLEVTSIPQTKVSLSVDRPFLFLIRDRPTGAVVFMGRVVDPTAVRARTSPQH